MSHYQRIFLLYKHENDRAFLDLLDGLDISHSEWFSKKSIFPSDHEGHIPLEIAIDDEDSPALFRKLDMNIPSKVVPVSTRSKIILRLIVAYGIVMSLLFLRYFFINQQYNNEKYLISSWSYNYKTFSTKRRSNKQLVSVYHDQNFDGNFELIEQFNQGTKIGEHIDQNEDSYFEEIRYYDNQGKLSGKELNKNQDDFLETLVFYLENGDTLQLVDRNGNFRYEMD